jgi:predicted MFS family arabinose efflux permease
MADGFRIDRIYPDRRRWVIRSRHACAECRLPRRCLLPYGTHEGGEVIEIPLARNPWVMASVSILVVMAALGLGRFGYAMILPAMSDGLRLTAVQAADIATANMVGYLVSSLVCGLLSARFGPRLVVTVSVLLVAAALAATALARDFPSAVVARLATGIASGGANVPVMGLLSSWFSPKRRGLASGMAVGGSSVGLVITGLLVPALMQSFAPNGWRASWVALGIIAAVVFLLCVLFLRNGPGAGPVAETRIADVVRSARVWFLGAVYFLFGFSYIMFSTFFVRHIIDEAGFTARGAGSLWSAIGVVSLASGFLWGAASDRMGRTKSLALVYALQSVAFATLGLWKGMSGALLSALLFALTAWSIPAIMAAASGDMVGSRLAPSALGFITVFFGIGQALGPLVAGRMAQASGSFAPAFIVAGAAALAGAALSLLLPATTALQASRQARRD